MISGDLRRELQAIGESGHFPGGGLLGDRDRAWRRLMCGHEPWQELAPRLNEFELRNLIRGLVLFSRVTGWSGGSVSPVIVLYRAYIERWPEREPALTGWIVDNRLNDYEPFGTICHGDARSQAELHQFRVCCAKDRAANMARDAERQQQAASLKAARATTRVTGAVRRGDVAALEALLRTGADLAVALAPGESLVELARANRRDKMVTFLQAAGLE